MSICPSFIHLPIHLSVCSSSIHPSIHPSIIHQFIPPSMHLPVCLSMHHLSVTHLFIHPPICPLSSHSSIQPSVSPASQPYNRYLLRADGVPGPAGHSLPWRGTERVMSRRGLRCALLPWDPAQDVHRLAPRVPPYLGLPDLVRREAALASQPGKPSLTICF